MSLQNRKGRRLDAEKVVEHAAIDALAGVGGVSEWWDWHPEVDRRVGHLRVPVTDDEIGLVPPGIVVDDAGDEGIMRPRTRP